MTKKKEILVQEAGVGIEKSVPISLSYDEAKSFMLEIIKADYPDFTGALEDKLNSRALIYLYSRFNGLSHYETVAFENLAPIEFQIWDKIPEFQSIISAVKASEANMLESVVWKNALDNPSASIERMFALKSRKQEYKDNGQAPAQSVTNVRISIDGQDFDVSANFKEKGELNG